MKVDKYERQEILEKRRTDCGDMDLTDSCSNLHAVINTDSGHEERLVTVLKDKRIYND